MGVQRQRRRVGLLANEAGVEEARDDRLELLFGQLALGAVDQAPGPASGAHPPTSYGREALAARARRPVATSASQGGLGEADTVRAGRRTASSQLLLMLLNPARQGGGPGG
jgi:hypothetical protein